jgi:hypothetical protein
MIKKIAIIFLGLICFFSSCGIYSFSGADYGTAKTISIKYFDNNAPIVNANLTQVLYDKMSQRFVSQTPLVLIPRGGDVNFDGQITGYDVKPVDIKAGEVSDYNRLTITVKVKYSNSTNTKNNFEKNFSWYADYLSSENLSSAEAALIETITEKIVDDIFQSAFVNW